MKRLFFILFLGLCAYCCASKNDISIIDGTWNRGKSGEISLFQIAEGELHKVASCMLDKGAKFYFAFKPEKEGLYAIGRSVMQARDNYLFYFKPGDRLNVVVNDTSYTLLIGENTKENEALEAWHRFVYPVADVSVNFSKSRMTYVDFFPLLEEKVKAYEGYKQQYNDNETFNRFFSEVRNGDLLYYALNFLSTPRMKQPSLEEYSNYYNTLNTSEITTTTSLMNHPYGVRILNMLRMLELQKSREKITSREDLNRTFDSFLALVKNDTLKGEVVIFDAMGKKNYGDFLDYTDVYGKYVITESQKRRLEEKMNQIADLRSGSRAVDFKFPDINGKEVALSDLKGKVVYVDVWATWCGPCIKEIPHLKELEAQYHGKDIVFLSVSTDTDKNIEKWKNFVKKEDLKGIQLISGNKSDKILKPYKINGIPRFMLFDKEGRIIDADAPRPSSENIRKFLDTALKAK